MKAFGRSQAYWCSVAWASLLVAACGRVDQRRPVEQDGAGVGNEAGGSVAGAGEPRGGAGSSEGGAEGLPAVAGGVGGAAGASVVEDGGAAGQGEINTAGVGAGGEPEPIHCDPIEFEDPELEATVRSFAGKASGPLFSRDVVDISYLVASGVTSLKGVECLTNLTSLDIGDLPGGSVSDLRPLAGLVKLESIAVSRNPIESLEPLGKLPNLEELFAFHVPVKLDLQPLSTAPKLTMLDLDGDTVEDLGPLGGVSTLETLNFRNGTLVHPEGASALKSVLDLDATGVFSDATPLSELTQLNRLRIGGKPLANFSKLASLVNLKFLDAGSTGIGTLAPLASMTKLVGFAGPSNQITDVTPLGGLRDLQILVLIGNPIRDVGPLAANPGIGAGDFVYLEKDELSCDAQAANIQAMRGRGADVSTDCP